MQPLFKDSASGIESGLATGRLDSVACRSAAAQCQCIQCGHCGGRMTKMPGDTCRYQCAGPCQDVVRLKNQSCFFALPEA
jgi:hypothetical protein